MSLDYTPQPGSVFAGIDLTHGIIRRNHAGRVNTVDRAMARRLDPHRRGEIDAYDYEVLLPRHAATAMRCPLTLVRTYEEQLLPDQQDLCGITTVRFAHDLPHHHAWELGRQFARASLNGRGLAVLMVHHVPSLAGRKHKPHLHLLWPVRVLVQEFGRFEMPTKAELIAGWQVIGMA
ncbi:hypothetical protein SAMN06297144_1225 [Sphingomonas guangdongensis]|uniref:MobA/MobL family protein n=1 Tax=Sphingomonas guangdongensis TaxID=1141890 RepID=A0A285QH18_9SPHN|nr:hypothetical protein [Sphingomonas guangdongensis]SOB80764.1 hypothetical protein SAMN06297144_1225 [Sphingomonas guangdongensis]